MVLRKKVHYSSFISSRKDRFLISGRPGDRVVPLNEILKKLQLSELKIFVETEYFKMELSLSPELGNFWIEIKEDLTK